MASLAASVARLTHPSSQTAQGRRPVDELPSCVGREPTTWDRFDVNRPRVAVDLTIDRRALHVTGTRKSGRVVHDGTTGRIVPHVLELDERAGVGRLPCGE